MSTDPKLTAGQAQMLLRMYTGQPELNHDTLTIPERQTLVELRRMGYRVPKGEGYGLTDAGTRRVHQLMGWPQAEVVDHAAVAAQEWLRTAKLGFTGFIGEHDEGGAAFRLEGVRFSGPAVGDFGRTFPAGSGLSPCKVYNAFTTELIARWNRGPVETE